MKKILPVLVIIFAMSLPACAEMIMTSASIETEVVKIEKPNMAYTMLDKIRKDRSTIYNVLNLTPCQISQTREIEKQRFEEITPLVHELMQKKRDLKALKYQEASNRELNCAKHEITRISKNIKCVNEKYDKKFGKILNSEQKAKYSMVQKLRRDDLKKLDKIEKNGAKQSVLRPFGENISQPAYKEKLKEENSLKNKCKKLLKKNK